MTTSNARSSEAASVPNGWRATTIGDVADIFSGATPSTEVASYWDGEIPWCIPTDITGTPGKYLLTTERNITHEGLVSSGASLLPEGSLLLCSRATIGDVKIAATTICTNQGFKSLVCKDGVSNEFLYYLIQPFKPRMLELATGSTFRELSKHDLGNITVALPPLPEQRAIAAVLSDIDGMLDALDALIAKKQDIKKATMQQLLTGKTRLPGFNGEWETKRLGDMALFFKGSPNISKSDLSPDGEKRCIHYGELFTTYNESIAEVLHGIDSEGTFVYSSINDVLMPSSDVTPNGLATASCLQIDGVILGGDILVIRVPDQIVNGEFLAYKIGLEREQVLQLVTGTTVYHLYGNDMANFRFTMPSAREQAAIAAVLSDMDAEIAALEERRDKTSALKQGMMQELLTGRIRLPATE